MADRALCGRRRELAVLTAALDDAAAGQGSLVLIGGEAGVGKTRLMAELVAMARRQEHVTLWAACPAGDTAPTLWPWLQVLRQLADLGHAADSELADTVAAGTTETGLLGDVDPAGTRARLFDRVVRRVCRAAGGGTAAVVILDDLQWADRSSVELLILLASALRTVGLLVVGAYRDTDVAADSSLAALLSQHSRDAERISLAGLPAGDVEALAEAEAGEPITGDLATSLHRHTAGNPFFVKELIRLLAVQGSLALTEPLPASIREVLDRQIARLTPRCAEVIAAASVIGSEFPINLLATSVGTDVDEMLRLLDEAAAARVVAEAAAGRFTFAHDLFRQAFYLGLPAERRLRLHLAVGEALERRRPHQADPVFTQLAHHFLVAAPIAGVDKAVDYALYASERAGGLGAFDQAAQQCERALAVLPGGAVSHRRAQLLIRLAEVRWQAQQDQAAAAAVDEAAEIARTLADGELFAKAALAGARKLAGNQAPTAAADHGLIALLEEALQRLPADDGELRCRLLARLAVELYLTPQLERRAELSAQALAMARRLGEPRALAIALYSRQIAMIGPAGLAERIEATDEMLDLARRAGDAELAFWGHLFRTWTRSEQCLPASDELTTCAELADRLKLPPLRIEVRLRQAIHALVACDFAVADSHLAEVHTLSRDHPDSPTLLSTTMVAAYLRGSPAELEPAAREVVRQLPGVPLWRAALATNLAEQGRLDEAAREFDVLAGQGFDLPRDGNWLYAMQCLAFVCFATGDRARAEQLHPIALPYADHAQFGVFGCLATGVGLLDAARGRWKDALYWLERSYGRDLAMGNEAFALWTLRERGAVLLAREETGDRDAANALLTDVVAQLDERGLTGFLDRAGRLLAESAAERPVAACELRREQDWWVIRYRGSTSRVTHAKGLLDLAVLLSAPGKEVHVADLVGAVRESGSGEMIDARAKAEYKARLAELEADIAGAEDNADLARAERARAERDAIIEHLSAALGLGGRSRRMSDSGERARKAVAWRIRRAIGLIAKTDPEAGRHLEHAVTTGMHCVYRPEGTPPPDRGSSPARIDR